MKNQLTKLLNVKLPIIQAGMVWCSPWQLAVAVTNSGGLGIIGSGSMYPEILEEHIVKAKANTKNPFGVNLPLIYPQVEDHIELIIKYKVPVVITSAGSPKKFTQKLKAQGIKVLHVVSSAKFAMKAQDAGVDAVIAEGFEAGGHNGREETTTMCLVPEVVQKVDVPVIAAGGIGSGKAMAAAFALGAQGVQIGSRFVASAESSAHNNFKQLVIDSIEGDTKLTLKELTPVRLLKSNFLTEIELAYQNEATPEQLKALLGKGRAKKGMFEGNLKEGELEIGQVASLIKKVQPASEIISEIIQEFNAICRTLGSYKF